MKAIILAAGVGKRLRPITDSRPKCLVEFNGKALIERYVEMLEALGVWEIVVVTGHLGQQISERLGASFGNARISYLHNAHYLHGNILTMYLARREFTDDVLLMDADMVLHPRLLELVIHSPNRSCYLMDQRDQVWTGEECLVAARNGRVVANNRRIAVPYDTVGEGLGVLKLDLATARRLGEIVAGFVETGELDREYEDALEVLLRERFVGFEPIGDLPWIEIDFPEDILRAQREILPSVPF